MRRRRRLFPDLDRALRERGLPDKPYCPRCGTELEPKRIDEHLKACTATGQIRVKEISMPTIPIVRDRKDPYLTETR
jgi:hypothetical protein